jgi:hypothetical protein
LLSLVALGEFGGFWWLLGGGALPTFRYDHTKAKEGRLLNLYRHDGTSWVRIGRAMPNADHLISAESALAPLSSGSMNIGFFAVVVPKAGMTVLFR